MTSLTHAAPAAPTEWVWEGYLARGAIALLTARWKGGKTTLVAGLLRHLSLGRPFLDRRCEPTTALVVSEESLDTWAERGRVAPFGPQVELLSRPFGRRPTPDEWDELVRSFSADRPGLLVVDPLAMFLPGRCESDPDDLAALFRPLRQLADGGTAVLILHHPRVAKAAEGDTARGGRPLLHCVDVALELTAVGQTPADSRLRRLTVHSRLADTPPVVYEWTRGTADFRLAEDPADRRFEDHWAVLREVLAGQTAAVTRRELLDDWPPELPCPSDTQLYRRLNRAADAGRVERTGAGTKGDPHRFRLTP